MSTTLIGIVLTFIAGHLALMMQMKACASWQSFNQSEDKTVDDWPIKGCWYAQGFMKRSLTLKILILDSLIHPTDLYYAVFGSSLQQTSNDEHKYKINIKG